MGGFGGQGLRFRVFYLGDRNPIYFLFVDTLDTLGSVFWRRVWILGFAAEEQIADPKIEKGSERSFGFVVSVFVSWAY